MFGGNLQGAGGVPTFTQGITSGNGAPLFSNSMTGGSTSHPSFGQPNLFGGQILSSGLTSSSQNTKDTEQSKNLFGGATSQTTNRFSGTFQQNENLFHGATFASAGTFGGQQTTSTFSGDTHNGTSKFGETDQQITQQSGNMFSGTSLQPSSTFGGNSQQNMSTFGGATQQHGSAFGGVTQHHASSFGGTTQQPLNTFDVTKEKTSTFGGNTHQIESSISNKLNAPNQASSQYLTASNLFGGSTTTMSSGMDEKNQKSINTTNTFSGISQSGNIFGGTTQETVVTPKVFGGSSQVSTSLFGATTDKEENSGSSVLFGKKTGTIENKGEGPERNRKSLWLNPSGTGGESQNQETLTQRTLRRPAAGDAGGLNLFKKAVAYVDTSEDRSKAKELKQSDSKEDNTVEESEGDPKNSSRHLIRRRSSISDELALKVAIVCKGLSSKYNNGIELRKHFNRYGKVTRVHPNPRKQMATVHFENHEDAKNAKIKGRSIERGGPLMQIFWSNYQNRLGITPEKRNPFQQVVRKQSNSELNEELESMTGTSDVTFGEINALNRPKNKTTRSISPAIRSQSPGVTARTTSSSPAPTKSIAHSIKSLQGLVGRNAQEKYEIINNCDKVVREALGLHMKQQTDLADAKTLVASCQDMCPEKERYQRIYQHRLHVYELIPGTDQVDHSRAVKEYSRSSADQELPLPSELRPPEVLDRTMNYLLNNIADDGEDGKWGDWFDFLWNRTRSIRKEITQLQLCDHIVVGLVEKCTRFHVFCSEVLCTEDAMVFDTKINNENLTKCLQTLKELYYDMQEKKGEHCPNEAEFRSYMVLMNLNEGDILREVQQLREEVRESPELRFVRMVHSALNSHNYIRFFKLVDRAEFLPACIMHRYFSQVRTKALHVMAKAYKSNPLQVSELRRLLLFESETEVKDFCEHHGLSVQDGCVNMDKHSIVMPEMPFGPTRAINVIESKQHTSVGEVINGAPLPVNDVRKATTSFREDGYFIPPTLPAQVEDKTVNYASQQPQKEKKAILVKEDAKTSQVIDPSLSSSKLVFNNEMVKDIAKELFVEIIKEFSTNMATTFVKAINVYLDKAAPLLEDIISGTVLEETKSVVEDCLLDYKMELAELQARERAEKSLSRERASHQISQEILDVVLSEQIGHVGHEEMIVVERNLKQQSIDRTTTDMIEEFLNTVLEEEVEDTAVVVYQTDVVDRLQQLEETKKAVELIFQARFFNRWKNRLAARQRLQKSMVTFPPVPSMDTVEKQIQHMLPESVGMTIDSIHLGNSAKLTLLSPGIVLQNQSRLEQSLVLHAYWSRIRHEKAWAPIEVTQIVGPPLMRIRKARQVIPSTVSLKKVQHFYWKLVVCLPCCKDDPVGQKLNDWICAKLTRGRVPISKMPNLSKLLSVYHRDINSLNRLGICIRVVFGLKSHNESEDIRKARYANTTSAVLFVLKDISGDPDEEYWVNEKRRLFRLLHFNNKLYITPSLVILVPFFGVARQKVETELGLESLLTYKHVTLTDIITIPPTQIEHATSSKKLIQALHEMAQQYHDIKLPDRQAMQEFVEDFLHQEFFTPVYQDLASRNKKGKLHHGPKLLLTLYNSIINHMRGTVSDPELTSIPWPMPEFINTGHDMPGFLWNNPMSLTMLDKFLSELALPEWDSQSVEEEDDWSLASQQVWNYIKTVTEGYTNHTSLFSSVENVLHKAHQLFEEGCWITLGVDDCNPLKVNMPWTEIIVACVNQRLSVFFQRIPIVDNTELEVYYFPTKLKFTPPPEWHLATREDQEDKLKDSFLRSVKRKHESSKSSQDSPSYRPTDSPRLSVKSETSNQVKSKEISHNLDLVVAGERKANENFEAYLERILTEGDSVNFSKPLQEINASFQFAEHEMSSTRCLSAPSSLLYSPGICPAKTGKQKRARHTLNKVNASYDFDEQRPRSAEAKFDSDLKITEKLDYLNSSLNSQKQASRLFEMKLQSFINMDKI